MSPSERGSQGTLYELNSYALYLKLTSNPAGLSAGFFMPETKENTMLQFKSKEDLKQLPPDDPAYPIVSDLVQRLIVNYEADGFGYSPDSDGWVCLVTENDVDRPIDEIWDDGTRLADLYWEGFTREGGHFIGVYLANDQWGLAVVIPDEPWVNGELRDVIEETLDPPVETQKAEV